MSINWPGIYFSHASSRRQTNPNPTIQRIKMSLQHLLLLRHRRQTLHVYMSAQLPLLRGEGGLRRAGTHALSHRAKPPAHRLILHHRQHLANATRNGRPSLASWAYMASAGYHRRQIRSLTHQRLDPAPAAGQYRWNGQPASVLWLIGSLEPFPEEWAALFRAPPTATFGAQLGASVPGHQWVRRALHGWPRTSFWPDVSARVLYFFLSILGFRLNFKF